MKPPLVSVGIPVYNSEKYIIHTLDSVKRQSYQNIELIVVDDGSTDKSGEQVQLWSKSNNFPITFIVNAKNLGLTKTCNVILRAAKGKYLQKLDADDVLLPHKIERHVKLLEELGEETALVYSDVELIDEDGAIIKQSYFARLEYDGIKTENVYVDLLKINFIPNPAVMSRIDAIRKVGGYDEELLFEDWDLWLRLSLKYKLFYDKAATCYYRIHSQSMMSDDTKIVLRNNTKIAVYKKNMGINKDYDAIILSHLKKLSIYSFYKGDREAGLKLKWYLQNKVDLKVLLYFILSSLKIKHPANFKGR